MLFFWRGMDAARQCAMKHSNDVQLSANQERAEQARRYRSNPNKKRGI
jgi:hypothetical protein